MPIGNYPLSSIALCTVEDVTALLYPNLKGPPLQLIAYLINGFSSDAEKETNRKFLKTQYTETFDGGDSLIVVDAPPIRNTSFFSVWQDPGRLFTNVNFKLERNVDYIVNYQMGAIRRVWPGTTRKGIFQPWPDSIQVTYDGGIVFTNETGEAIDSPDDLRKACAFQVSYWFQNKKNLGLQSVSDMGNWAQNFTRPTDWLPTVAHTLLNNRHHKV